MRRRFSRVVASAVVAGGLMGTLSFGLSSSTAARPSHTASGAHCPARAQVLPSDAVARAADRARIEAAHLYPHHGRVVVTQSSLAPFASVRGKEVRVQCGPRAFHRTVVVGLFFPKELPSASLSQGTVFVSRFATRYRVWEVAH